MRTCKLCSPTVNPVSTQGCVCSCPGRRVGGCVGVHAPPSPWVPAVHPRPGLTLHWHCPLVLLQSGSKPLLTAQWQGPHTGFPHQPLGHGRSILLGNQMADGRCTELPFLEREG